MATLWLSNDKKGHKLWFSKPSDFDPRGRVFHSEYRAVCHGTGRWETTSTPYISLDFIKNIEDIFVKLDGTELQEGDVVQVNLVEHFKGSGYDEETAEIPDKFE